MDSNIRSVIRFTSFVWVAAAAGAGLRAQPTTRVSVDSQGAQANGSSGLSSAISDDGRFVAFDSWASNLVPQDTNNVGRPLPEMATHQHQPFA